MLLSNVAFEDHPAIADVKQREHDRFRQLEQESLGDWNNRAIFNRRSRAIYASSMTIIAFGVLAYPVWSQYGSTALRITLATAGTIVIVMTAIKVQGRKPQGDMHPWRSHLIDSATEILRVYAELGSREGMERELGPLLTTKGAHVAKALFNKYVAGYETANYAATNFTADLQLRLSSPAHPEQTVLWELIEDSKPSDEMDIPDQTVPFPNRVKWLKDRLLERGWSSGDPYKFHGPDRKTVEKILQGESVRNDVLEKLATALSGKFLEVNATEIPKD